jgi:hypothetical protein
MPFAVEAISACVKYAEGSVYCTHCTETGSISKECRRRSVCGENMWGEEGTSKKYRQLISWWNKRTFRCIFFTMPNIGPQRDCNYTTVRIAVKQTPSPHAHKTDQCRRNSLEGFRTDQRHPYQTWSETSPTTSCHRDDAIAIETWPDQARHQCHAALCFSHICLKKSEGYCEISHDRRGGDQALPLDSGRQGKWQTEYNEYNRIQYY